MEASDTVFRLNRLIENIHHMIIAYETAIPRLGNLSYKTRLGEFRQNYRQLVQELSKTVENYGGIPVAAPESGKGLSEGGLVVAEVGGDRAILETLRSSEEKIGIDYEKIAGEIFPEEPLPVLRSGLSKIRHHREWFEGL